MKRSHHFVIQKYARLRISSQRNPILCFVFRKLNFQNQSFGIVALIHILLCISVIDCISTMSTCNFLSPNKFKWSRKFFNRFFWRICIKQSIVWKLKFPSFARVAFLYAYSLLGRSWVGFLFFIRCILTLQGRELSKHKHLLGVNLNYILPLSLLNTIKCQRLWLWKRVFKWSIW